MTHIWAHRRASAEAPENTLAAIARGLSSWAPTAWRSTCSAAATAVWW